MLEGQSFILQVGDAEDFDEPPKEFPTGCLNHEKQATAGADILAVQMYVLCYACLVFIIKI